MNLKVSYANDFNYVLVLVYVDGRVVSTTLNKSLVCCNIRNNYSVWNSSWVSIIFAIFKNVFVLKSDDS